MTKIPGMEGGRELFGLPELLFRLFGLLKISIRNTFEKYFSYRDVGGPKCRWKVAVQQRQRYLRFRLGNVNLSTENAKAPVPLRADPGIFFGEAIGIAQCDIQVAVLDRGDNLVVLRLRIARKLAPSQQAAAQQNPAAKKREK
jgi:hypothetical protein